jgi:hypothetical protein
MQVRAERRIWEKLPEDEWLSRDRVLEILVRDCGMNNAYGQASAAVGWLLDGKWVQWRQAPGSSRRPLSSVPPPLQFKRNPLSAVPHEAMTQQAAEDLERQRVQVKSERDAVIDQRVEERLRELGLVNDTNQEA